MSQRPVVLAGFAVVAVGIACLYLSEAVARTGSWWQGTLEAFGVGFVVGGLIDVLAISGLNQVLTREQTRRENNRDAIEILDSNMSREQKADAAIERLRRSGSIRDRNLYAMLRPVLTEATDKDLEVHRRALKEPRRAHDKPFGAQLPPGRDASS